MDWATILLGNYISGIVIAIQGILKLLMNKSIMKCLPRSRKGSADLIARLIVVGIILVLMFYVVGSAIFRIMTPSN
jgi:hypothetical protein